MKSFLSLRTVVAAASLLLLSLALASQSHAQTDDGFGDSGADPVKLFERGQSAHARGDLQKALEFYEQALKVRPEFPEAEFQKGVVLVSLGRFPEAETALKRAIALKKNWSLPYSALGALFVKQSRDAEAESLFRQALTVDAQDAIEGDDVRDRRLADTDDADLVGFHEPNRARAPEVVRKRGSRHPTCRATADDDDVTDQRPRHASTP